MWAPLLASAAFGFLKGLAQPAQNFSTLHNIYGPVREELIYRGGPFWTLGNVPYGSTAAMFAADHVLSDLRRATANKETMSAKDVMARFGDVAFGGFCYEVAMRESGFFGALVAHLAHNAAVALGSRARR